MATTSNAKAQQVATHNDDDTMEPIQPEPEGLGIKEWTILGTVLLAMFLVSVDRSIISTAIPAITDEFNDLSGYGWYGSSYLLTCCAFQLLFGRIYTFFPVKHVLLISVLIFEVASAVCGAAPSSTAFIVGRAISGVGAAGIFAGAIVCTVFVVPLHMRPKIQGLTGAVFGISSITGPLIGGALTSNVTWRWCFYLNLPIGGFAMVVIFLLLKVPDRKETKFPLSEKLKKLDFVGTAVFVPGTVCLLLALQWGGQTYAWSEWRIILLLTLAGVLLAAFAAVQIWMPATATLPPRLFKQRSVVSAVLATFSIMGSTYIYTYYLPTWFQSIQGVDSADSGVHLLPIMITMILGSLVGGFTNTKIGYYTPLAIIGSCIMSVGAGLITTFWLDTSEGKWIGYQVLYGIGVGLCFQVPNLAIQAVLPKAEVPTGLALMLFTNLLGSSIFVSVGENVLSNQLISRLAKIPGFSKDLVTSSGATSLIDALPSEYRNTVLVAYNESLQKVFQIALILSCIAVLGCATLEWKNIKKGKDNMATAEAAASAEEKMIGGEKKDEAAQTDSA